jgi:hypothetical protein
MVPCPSHSAGLHDRREVVPESVVEGNPEVIVKHEVSS